MIAYSQLATLYIFMKAYEKPLSKLHISVLAYCMTSIAHLTLYRPNLTHCCAAGTDITGVVDNYIYRNQLYSDVMIMATSYHHEKSI
jgi:hypothetical protein